MDKNIVFRKYPCDLVCLHKKNDKAFESELHNHDGFEFLYVVSGRGALMIEDDIIPIDEPKLFVIPSGCQHKISVDEVQPYERYTLNISGKYVKSILKYKNHKYIDKVLSSLFYINVDSAEQTHFDRSHMESLFRRIIGCNGDILSHESIFNVMLLFGYVISETFNEDSLFRLTRFFDEKIQNFALNKRIVNDIENIPYSIRHLNRVLKKYFDTNINTLNRAFKYIALKRIQKSIIDKNVILRILEYKDWRSIQNLEKDIGNVIGEKTCNYSQKSMYFLD